MPGRRPAREGLIPAIGYIRVSLAREEMISPELQQKSIEAWGRRSGYRIIDWVSDLDKSGRNFNRKIMGAIERIESGEAKAIIVWKFSRFGRSRTGVPANLARVETAGGAVLSATEDIDAETAFGRLQRGMIGEFNAFESERIGEQWMESHEYRREQGLPATGKKRFGYIWHPRKVYAPDGSVTLQREWYEPDEKLVSTVEQLYIDYVSGIAFNAAARRLNRDGVVNAQGKLWADTSLRYYMDSGFAAGYLRVHDDECPCEEYSNNCRNHILVKHPQAHDGIISEDLWQKYLARREFCRTAPPKSRSPKYHFTGIVKCPRCRFIAKRMQNQRGLVSYSCATRNRKGRTACEGCRVQLGALTDHVLKWLAHTADEIADEASEATSSHRSGSVARSGAAIEATKARIEKIEKAVAKLMRTYAMSEDDDPHGILEQEYRETLGRLRGEKEEAQGRLAEMTGEREAKADLADQKAAAVPVMRSLLEEWNLLPPQQVNALLRQLVKEIILHDDEIEVVPTWEAETSPRGNS